MKNNANKIVILLINNLDIEDFAPILQYSQFKKNLLVIFDTQSITDYPPCSIECIKESFKHPEQIITRIHEWNNIHNKQIVGIIGLDEEYRYSVAQKIAHAFSLPYYTDKTIEIASNKYLQRIGLDKQNVPTPKFKIFQQLSDAEDVPFPNVLKIISGIGSNFIYFNKDVPQLQHNLEDFRKKSSAKQNNNLILEQFIPGNEYSCDFMISDKTVNVLRVVKKITNPEHFAFFEGFYLFNPDYTANAAFSLSALEKLCTKAAQALDAQRGVCMIDFKFYDGQFFVIETTIRPGIAQFIELMAELYDYTSVDMLIRQILNLDTHIAIPTSNGLIFYITTNQSGILKKFDCSFIENNKTKFGIHAIEKYYHEGQDIEPYATKMCKAITLGHIIINNIDADKINETMQGIREKIIIEFK